MSLTEMLGEKFDTKTHRLCGTCESVKPVSEFYKDGKTPAGETKYRRDCKECYKVVRLREAKMKRNKAKGGQNV